MAAQKMIIITSPKKKIKSKKRQNHAKNEDDLTHKMLKYQYNTIILVVVGNHLSPENF